MKNKNNDDFSIPLGKLDIIVKKPSSKQSYFGFYVPYVPLQITRSSKWSISLSQWQPSNELVSKAYTVVYKNPQRLCDCSMTDIMRHGCKCGGK